MFDCVTCESIMQTRMSSANINVENKLDPTKHLDETVI